MWASVTRLLRSRGIGIIVIGVTGAVLTLQWSGALQLLESALLDQWFRLRPAESGESRVVIVTIDEPDISRLKQWPMSDATLAKLIQKLKIQQPAFIGLDLYRDLLVEPGHQELLQVYASTPNLIGIEKVLSDGNKPEVASPPVLRERNQVAASDLVLDTDGKVRRHLLSVRDPNGKTSMTLGLKLALAYLEAQNITPEASGKDSTLIKLGMAEFLPLQENEGGYVRADVGGFQILANFQRLRGGVPKISLTDVLEDRVPANLMRGRIVLIGVVAESLKDTFYTPYTTDPQTLWAGVELHANLTSQILSAALDGRQLLRGVPEPLEWLWVLLWSGVGAGLGWKVQLRWTIVLIATVSLSLIGSAYLSFLGGWWITTVSPFLAFVSTWILSRGYLLWHKLQLSYQALESYAQTLELKVQERTQKLETQNLQLSAEIAVRERAEAEILFLLSTTQAIAEADDFESALSIIVRSCCKTIGADLGEAWIPNADDTLLECSQGGYASDPSLEEFIHSSLNLTFAPGIALPGRIWLSKKPEWIEDVSVEQEPIFQRLYLTATGIKAGFGVPILVDDQVLAILVFFMKSVSSEQSHWVELVNVAATQLGSLVGRKQAEVALRIAEENYHDIVENAIEGIFQSTPDGRYKSANPALARIYGYDSPEDLLESIEDIGRQVYVDSNRHQQYIAELSANNEVKGFESLVYRKNGEVIWISENTRAVRDAQGTLLYYEGTISEITERILIQEALKFQQEETEKLLLNVLPASIAKRLQQGERVIAERFEEVSVLFADLVGFTEFCSRKTPEELVNVLNIIFSHFDELAQQHGLEKIKTIGDAYMVVGGLPTPRTDHAEAIAQMALDMQAELENVNRHINETFEIRIGINTGPVVAGVIGLAKFIYDLWGDTVNTASRMESNGIPGEIQVTDATYERLKEQFFFEKRSHILIKGKGEMTTYLLKGRIRYL